MFLNKHNYWSVRMKKGRGRSVILSTHKKNREEALEVVNAAHLKEIDLAHRAGVLTNEAVSLIMHGCHSSPMQTVIGEWAGWMATSSSLSSETRHRRFKTAKHFIEFAGLKMNLPSEVTSAHIKQYINRPSPVMASTRECALNNLTYFFEWCRQRGMTRSNVVEICRVDYSALDHSQKEKKERVPITDQEIEKLLDKCEAKGEDFWWAAIQISRLTALRLGDVCMLEWKSITADEITVWTRKADKRVCLESAKALTDLFENLERTHEKWVFPPERLTYADPETRCFLSIQFRRLADSCGVKGSFHCLRYARAQEINRDFGIQETARQLGHSSWRTSQIYTKTNGPFQPYVLPSALAQECASSPPQNSISEQPS